MLPLLLEAPSIPVGDGDRRHRQVAGGSVVRWQQAVGDTEVSLINCNKNVSRLEHVFCIKWTNKMDIELEVLLL